MLAGLFAINQNMHVCCIVILLTQRWTRVAQINTDDVGTSPVLHILYVVQNNDSCTVIHVVTLDYARVTLIVVGLTWRIEHHKLKTHYDEILMRFIP